MKLQSIQALRGLAALFVVIYHTRALELKSIAENGLTEAPLIAGAFTNGYAGVDLFFVISGFIMVYVTQAGQSGLRPAAEFLFARAARIYPVWWAFAGLMVVYVVVAYGVSGDNPGWAAASNGQPTGPFLFKSFLLQPQAAFPILSVGWTLVHEMYFYLVFSLLMLSPRRLVPIFLAGWAAIIVAGSVLGVAEPYAVNWLTLAVHPMTAEFILGTLAGLLVTHGIIRHSGILTLIAMLWLLVGLCYQGVEDSAALMWGRVIWFGLPCTLFVYGAAGLDLHERRAWLLPALVGLAATVAIHQFTGFDETTPAAARRAATILSVLAGAIAMLAVIWFGWLLGQRAPHLLTQTRPHLSRLLAFAVKLGDWSFALYLGHLLVLSLVRSIFSYLGRIDALAPVFRLGHPGRLDNLAFAGIGIPLTIVAAWLTFCYFEQPVTRLFTRLRRRLFRQEAAQPASTV